MKVVRLNYIPSNQVTQISQTNSDDSRSPKTSTDSRFGENIHPNPNAGTVVLNSSGGNKRVKFRLELIESEKTLSKALWKLMETSHRGEEIKIGRNPNKNHFVISSHTAISKEQGKIVKDEKGNYRYYNLSRHGTAAYDGTKETDKRFWVREEGVLLNPTTIICLGGPEGVYLQPLKELDNKVSEGLIPDKTVTEDVWDDGNIGSTETIYKDKESKKPKVRTLNGGGSPPNSPSVNTIDDPRLNNLFSRAESKPTFEIGIDNDGPFLQIYPKDLYPFTIEYENGGAKTYNRPSEDSKSEKGWKITLRIGDQVTFSGQLLKREESLQLGIVKAESESGTSIKLRIKDCSQTQNKTQ